MTCGTDDFAHLSMPALQTAMERRASAVNAQVSYLYPVLEPRLGVAASVWPGNRRVLIVHHRTT